MSILDTAKRLMISVANFPPRRGSASCGRPRQEKAPRMCAARTAFVRSFEEGGCQVGDVAALHCEQTFYRWRKEWERNVHRLHEVQPGGRVQRVNSE